jgi:hypothetical protein
MVRVSEHNQRSLIIHSYAPGSSADSKVAAQDMHTLLSTHDEQAQGARGSRQSANGGNFMFARPRERRLC